MTESGFNGTIKTSGEIQDKLSREIKEIQIKKFIRDQQEDPTEGSVCV